MLRDQLQAGTYTRTIVQEVSEIVQRVGEECERMGTHSAQLVRVRPDYYDLSLEERRGLLKAPTTSHLCKSLVMENTKATDEDLSVPGSVHLFSTLTYQCHVLTSSIVHSRGDDRV